MVPDPPVTDSRRLDDNPVHLGLGATAVVQPTFTGGMEWYQGYGLRYGDDGRFELVWIA